METRVFSQAHLHPLRARCLFANLQRGAAADQQLGAALSGRETSRDTHFFIDISQTRCHHAIIFCINVMQVQPCKVQVRSSLSTAQAQIPLGQGAH